MIKVINTEKLFNVGVVLVLILALAGWFFSPYLTSGQSTVTVTATIAAAITCSASTTTIAFGTIDQNSVYGGTSQDTQFTLSCPNAGGGCILNATSSGNGVNGGLYASAVPKLIPSTNASFANTATLAAGTEGFGILATSTFTTGGFGINTRYNRGALTSNSVGKVTTSTYEFASSSGSITTATGTTRHKVAAAVGTEAGSYTENIAYACTAN